MPPSTTTKPMIRIRSGLIGREPAAKGMRSFAVYWIGAFSNPITGRIVIANPDLLVSTFCHPATNFSCIAPHDLSVMPTHLIVLAGVLLFVVEFNFGRPAVDDIVRLILHSTRPVYVLTILVRRSMLHLAAS